jgi:hypothetical protein
MLSHESAHLTHLPDVHDDPGNADDVVVMTGDLTNETLARGEVEHRAWRADVVLDQHQSPTAMKHAERERTLLACDLVVIELGRVDRTRSELVVSRERLEDRCQEHARARTAWMRVHAPMIRRHNSGSDEATKLLQSAGMSAEKKGLPAFRRQPLRVARVAIRDSRLAIRSSEPRSANREPRQRSHQRNLNPICMSRGP